MPAFSLATSNRGRAGEIGVIQPDVGDHGNGRVDDVGRVPSSQQSDLDHGHVDGDVCEVPKGHGSRDLEERGPHAHEQFQIGDGPHRRGEVLVGDGLGVDRDPLVDPLQVRAGVRADAQALGHQQPGGHLGDRALAIGTGDVDHRVAEVRIAHRIEQALDLLGRGGGEVARRLVTGVLRDVVQRLEEVQAQDAARRGRLVRPASRGTRVGFALVFTVSASITTLPISLRPGRSYIVLSSTSSRIARKPRAPVARSSSEIGECGRGHPG